MVFLFSFLQETNFTETDTSLSLSSVTYSDTCVCATNVIIMRTYVDLLIKWFHEIVVTVDLVVLSCSRVCWGDERETEL